ncbi:MAG: DUF1461 domain-containing protein [Actinomycetia bacterium]|nr:DUF1461 domain-containing protein [Actinomycetes bacterium]
MEAEARSKQGHPAIAKLLQALLVVILAVWLIGASFTFLLLGPVTNFWANRFVNDQLSSLSHSELVACADAGLAYIKGHDVSLPTGTDQRVSFTADVVSHLDDVRSVVFVARVLTLVLGLLLVAGAVALGRQSRRRLGSVFIWGAVLALAIVAVLALVGFLSFDVLFTAMHQLLFPQGNWTFDVSSLLICTYPLAFWTAMAATWAAILVVLCLLALGGGLSERHTAQRSAKQAV